jgi:hypothetical protein
MFRAPGLGGLGLVASIHPLFLPYVTDRISWNLNMHLFLTIVGLGLNVTGGLILVLADAWFSQSVLVYLDAVEANLSKVIQDLRSGGNQFVDAGVDLRRDRSQNRARFLKLLGWTALLLGFLCQLIAVLLRVPSHSS